MADVRVQDGSIIISNCATVKWVACSESICVICLSVDFSLLLEERLSGLCLGCHCVEKCAKCYAEQLQAKYLAQMVYENATIYVSKVAEVDRTIAHAIDSEANMGTGLDASSTAFSDTLSADDYVSVTDEQVQVYLMTEDLFVSS